MDGFRVDGAALATHAVEADRCADRVRRAAEAGTPLGLGAYGLVGQVFAAAAVGAAATVSGALARLADTAHDLGDGVRANLDGYREAERRAAAAFDPHRDGGR